MWIDALLREGECFDTSPIGDGVRKSRLAEISHGRCPELRENRPAVKRQRFEDADDDCL